MPQIQLTLARESRFVPDAASHAANDLGRQSILKPPCTKACVGGDCRVGYHFFDRAGVRSIGHKGRVETLNIYGNGKQLNKVALKLAD